MTSSWFFLSTLNYDARSTTHQKHLHVSAQVCHLQGVFRTRKRKPNMLIQVLHREVIKPSLFQRFWYSKLHFLTDTSTRFGARRGSSALVGARRPSSALVGARRRSSALVGDCRRHPQAVLSKLLHFPTHQKACKHSSDHTIALLQSSHRWTIAETSWRSPRRLIVQISLSLSTRDFEVLFVYRSLYCCGSSVVAFLHYGVSKHKTLKSIDKLFL